jgi:hypothetical protein
MRKSPKKYILRFYNGKDDIDTPRIFNIINLVGFLQNINGLDIIDVIYYSTTDPFFKTPSTLGLKLKYNTFFEQLSNIIRDKLATQWLILSLLRNSHSKVIDDIDGF